MTIIAAQQPYYLPDFNFFLKIVQSDVFLLADHLKFRKQSEISRAYIEKNKISSYLSVPARHTSAATKYINQVEICNAENWRRKHLRTMEFKFRKYPFFEFYFPQIKKIFQKEHRFLLDFEKDLIFKQIEFLALKCEIRSSSELNIVDLKTLRKWIDSHQDPILLIHPKEKEYYKNYFPKNDILEIKIPNDISFPKGYHLRLPLLILLFLKGPESIIFLKKFEHS